VNRILLVRMSALGDIVHALPVLSAIREAHPNVQIDWLADRPYADVLGLVDGVSQRIIGRPRLPSAVGELRARNYDVAIDLQGLVKSAAMARLSGARRVIGFETAALRERLAGWFYNEQATVSQGAHVIQKNLSVLPLLDVPVPTGIRFPFVVPSSSVAENLAADAAARGPGSFVLINPGAAWPNKRWAPSRFGALARTIRDRHGLPSYVLWGRTESVLADAVAASSDGAAVRAPETSLGDLLALSKRAALMISGDTGPLHLAAAMSTPIVGLYGPTWPERNGPWHADDIVLSRAPQCSCHHKRSCQRRGASTGVASQMCINDISIEEVVDAVDRRLASARR
jgi:heptosyltransferase I